MAQVIWKHTLPVNDEITTIPWFTPTLVMRAETSPSADEVFIWVAYSTRPDTYPGVVPTADLRIVGTGHEFEEGWIPLVTAPHPTIPLVWHVIGRVQR